MCDAKRHIDSERSISFMDKELREIPIILGFYPLHGDNHICIDCSIDMLEKEDNEKN